MLQNDLWYVCLLVVVLVVCWRFGGVFFVQLCFYRSRRRGRASWPCSMALSASQHRWSDIFKAPSANATKQEHTKLLATLLMGDVATAQASSAGKCFQKHFVFRCFFFSFLRSKLKMSDVLGVWILFFMMFFLDLSSNKHLK